MNKKFVLIGCAVLAFFAGQIFLEATLAARGLEGKTLAEFLVPVFEFCIGGFLGYLWGKDKFEDLVDSYKLISEDLRNKNFTLAGQLASINEEVKLLKKAEEKKEVVPEVSTVKPSKKAKKQSKQIAQ